MKLTQAQKSFLTDVVYSKCHEIFTAKAESESSKASYLLFENCLESFDVSLIPPCSSLIPAFINYYQSKIITSAQV